MLALSLSPPAASTPSRSARRPRPHVLLVADDPGALRDRVRLFGRTSEASAEAAVEAARTAGAEVVLLHLPGREPVASSVCAALRDDAHLQHVGLLVIDAEPGRRLDAYAAGADVCLAALPGVPELAALVGALARRARSGGTPLSQEDGRQEGSEAASPFLARADALIDEALSDPAFNALGLADAMQISARHLQRRFVQATGETPASRIRLARVERARRLLEEGESLAAARQAVGFGSPASFRSAFRAVHGITPSDYVARLASL